MEWIGLSLGWVGREVSPGSARVGPAGFGLSPGLVWAGLSTRCVMVCEVGRRGSVRCVDRVGKDRSVAHLGWGRVVARVGWGRVVYWLGEGSQLVRRGQTCRSSWSGLMRHVIQCQKSRS